MSENEKTVYIVDTEKLISRKGINYFWRGYSSPQSILHILEKNSKTQKLNLLPQNNHTDLIQN